MIRKFILIVLLHGITLAAYSASVSNIYIEAQGNNGYEAKAKAEHLGRKRALMMLARNLSLMDNPDEMSFDDLASVFTISSVIGEKITSVSYSATVTLNYSRADLNKLFLKYFPNSSRKLFAEYLVIPVFKQGSKIQLWLKDNEWLKSWGEYRSELTNARLLLASNFAALRRGVTSSNIFDLRYSDLLELVPETLFKGALIVVLEHYTYDSGYGYMAVDYITLENDNTQEPELYSENITIASQQEIPEATSNIIENILYNYGSEYVDSAIDSKQQAVSTPTKAKEKPAFIMRAEFYNSGEQEELTAKLNSIKFIKKVEIKHDFGAKFSVALYTELSEEELAKELYKNQLSYVKRGDSYLLINVINGV